MKRETIKNVLATGAALAVVLVPAVALAQLFNPVNPFGGGPVITGSSIVVIIRQIVNFIMTVSVILGVAAFVFGGVMFATGGGGERTESGKKWMKNAAIGILAILAVGLIVNSIAALVQRGGQIG